MVREWLLQPFTLIELWVVAVTRSLDPYRHWIATGYIRKTCLTHAKCFVVILNLAGFVWFEVQTDIYLQARKVSCKWGAVIS